ncbi:MAG TPA: pitrilysin family protein [Bacteroidota bacterium]
MKRIAVPLLLLSLALSTFSCKKAPEGAYNVPVTYYKLGNGLKVVLSEDHTSPTVVVGVYYNIGFRIEPKDRTGFAHLFEHMMFQGSHNLGKMEFIRLVEKNGGELNGSTRFDFTNYFELVPSNKLETMLWAEADRMKGLAITQDNLTNQQGVVTNEVKVNVLNTPYGGFPWLDLPQAAFKNWYNAHNFYGDLKDIEAATLADVQSFFAKYYAPNNASLVVTGDFDPGSAKSMIEKYFAAIPAVERPPAPDLTEPRQEERRMVARTDSLASRPAFAFGYQMPPRFTPDFFAMGLIDQILLQGDDAMLRDALVRKRGWTDAVGGGINAELGNMFDYNGPMLWSGSFIHDASVTPEAIMAVLDSVTGVLRTRPLDRAVLDRARVKFRSSLYDQLAEFVGFGKANLLAALALFDDDPGKINTIEDQLAGVTPEQIQKTAETYLRSTNQTVVVLNTKTNAR